MYEHVSIISSYHKALEWIRHNTMDEQGAVVSSKQPYPYLEVTGYLIPTLMQAGEHGLAYQYAEFLSYMQRPNGSFAGPDGVEYIFDSGQALRGLLCAAHQWDQFKPFAQKCADYIVRSMEPSGRLPVNYGGVIPEAVHVFVLPALREAADILNQADYRQASQKSLYYYKNFPDVLEPRTLTHFLAYIMDGFIDMGEADFVRLMAQETFRRQKSNGAISAYPHVGWVCSVGLAQLGIIAHKLNFKEQAEGALTYLIKHQNKTGGFFGSYGLGGDYFPKEEISWANKFFLDFIHLKESSVLKAKEPIAKLDHEQWHEAMISETPDQIAHRLKKNRFAVWARPLLEKTSAGEVVLELGSGTGELSAILSMYGRQMHLLDYSSKSLEYSKTLFHQMGLTGQYYVADILESLPLSPNAVDWVFSSGVLEHFTDEQMVEILRKSMNISRRGVMSLVPNSHSLFYRIGKHAQEEKGQWLYGHEIPKPSMKSHFERAGLKNVQEYSLGTYHAFQFWGKQHPDIRHYFNTLSPLERQGMNQGYLLFTYGEKHA